AYGDVHDAQEARDPVRAEDLLRTMAPELFGSGAGAPQTLLPEGETRWRERQQQSERAEIQRVLDQCGGDRRLASERLGISRTTLWRKLRVD
ncbi:MAG TPA: helix-turn-helix domain-containing protein, partial [Aquabacterium sp.]|nr:helix-turn-helix domain-containing protein [Aquabacterium sp.]